MMPRFANLQAGIGAELLCPNCLGAYIHHEFIEVFARPEDAPDGIHVGVTIERATIDKDLTGNPSARRDGIKIVFSCEECGATSVLSLAQHKGNTIVGFEYLINE